MQLTTNSLAFISDVITINCSQYLSKIQHNGPIQVGIRQMYLHLISFWRNAINLRHYFRTFVQISAADPHSPPSSAAESAECKLKQLTRQIHIRNAQQSLSQCSMGDTNFACLCDICCCCGAVVDIAVPSWTIAIRYINDTADATTHDANGHLRQYKTTGQP